MDLKGFFAQNAIQTANKNYVASQRFLDDAGNPLIWELKVLTNEEQDLIIAACKRKVWNTKTHEFKIETDAEKMSLKMVCQSVVYPDLNDSALQDSYGVVGAEALIKRMLTPGEYTDLVAAVQEAAGYKAGMDELVTTAKN